MYIGRQISNLSDRVKLDSITASATATYNLLLNSVAHVPSSAESLTVSLNGVIQAPQSSYTVSGSQITFASALTSSDSIDFILAERSITFQTPSSGSVGITELAVSDGTNGQALTTNGSGTLSFSTISGTTINNNADNRIITGSGTANTLEGEANLTYDGSTLTVKPSSNVHQLKLEQNNATDYWSLHADSSGGPLSFNRYTGGAETENMRIDSSGHITQPLQSAFHAKLGTAASNVTGDGTDYDVSGFGTERVDRNSDFNTTSGIFTAPITGLYALSFTSNLSGIDSSMNDNQFKLVTSNEEYGFLGEVSSSSIGFSGAMKVAFTMIVDMDTSDTAFVRIDFRGSSKTVDVSADTVFSGYLLG